MLLTRHPLFYGKQELWLRVICGLFVKVVLFLLITLLTNREKAVSGLSFMYQTKRWLVDKFLFYILNYKNCSLI